MSTTKPITFTYRDKTYTTAPENLTGCRGCAFTDDNFGCQENSSRINSDCCLDNIIYIEVKPKLYTVEEILRVYLGYQITQPSNPYALALIARVQAELDKQADPEYNTYLELKKKYEPT